MNLVLQVMSGVTLAGLAEGMALADRAGLQQKDVMEIMELTSLACPLMIEKGKGESTLIICCIYLSAMEGLGRRVSIYFCAYTPSMLVLIISFSVFEFDVLVSAFLSESLKRHFLFTCLVS